MHWILQCDLRMVDGVCEALLSFSSIVTLKGVLRTLITSCCVEHDML